MVLSVTNDTSISRGSSGGVDNNEIPPLGGGHEQATAYTQGNETTTATKISIPQTSYKRQPFFNDSEWRVIL